MSLFDLSSATLLTRILILVVVVGLIVAADILLSRAMKKARGEDHEPYPLFIVRIFQTTEFYLYAAVFVFLVVSVWRLILLK